MLAIKIAGRGELQLEHLLLDVNGTITDRGELIDGVVPLIRAVADDLNIHLVSADTFGTAEAIARELSATFNRVETGAQKRAYAEELGAGSCAAIGNGANDIELMRVCALAVAVTGPEGLSSGAVAAADVICPSILVALGLFTEPRTLSATLRA